MTVGEVIFLLIGEFARPTDVEMRSNVVRDCSLTVLDADFRLQRSFPPSKDETPVTARMIEDQ